MDINFDGLVAQGKVLQLVDVNPNEDYFVIAKYDGKSKEFKHTQYPVYAIKASDVISQGGSGSTAGSGLSDNGGLIDLGGVLSSGALVDGQGSFPLTFNNLFSFLLSSESIQLTTISQGINLNSGNKIVAIAIGNIELASATGKVGLTSDVDDVILNAKAGDIRLDCTGSGQNGSVVLIPVTQASVTTPGEGSIIYNSATKKLNFWNGASWEVVTSI